MATKKHTPFQLVAGNVVLDFVNTLDNRFRPVGPKGGGGPEELLATYGDLIRFMAQSEMLSATEAAVLGHSIPQAQRATILAVARHVRETLASTFYKIAGDREAGADANRSAGPDPTEVAALNVIIKSTLLDRELEWVGDWRGGKMVWTWSGGYVDLPVYRLVTAASELLTSDALGLLKSCESPTCRWLFLTTSKNKGRRWCDMAVCGNRMKARRSYSRARKSASS